MERPSFTEAGSALLIGGAFFDLLPKIGVAIGIVYYLISIWDSPVGRRWRKRWRGLFFLVLGRTAPESKDETMTEITKRLADIRAARDDRILLCMVLGLMGTGIAMALIVAMGVVR